MEAQYALQAASAAPIGAAAISLWTMGGGLVVVAVIGFVVELTRRPL